MGVRGKLHVPAALSREKGVGRGLLGGCGGTADSVWTLKIFRTDAVKIIPHH
jgi:hypothetical protein